MSDLARVSEELSEETFLKWWRSLPTDDQAEFTGVFGGDQLLARFVCAYHYLTLPRSQHQAGHLIVLAYAIATGLDPNDDETRIRAAKAWRHDAVQSLLDRLRYRGARQAAERITLSVTKLLEDEITRVADKNYKPVVGVDKGGDIVYGDPADTRVKYANTAIAFLKLVQREDVADRAERAKRGYTAAREALAKAQDAAENESITPDKFRLFLRMAQDELGPEAFRQITAEVEIKALTEAP